MTTTPHWRILLRSVATTAVAVLAALVVFVLDRSLTGATISERDWLETTIIPIIVGMPIAWYVFAQGEKLRRAYQQLAALNSDTEQAHNQLKQAHELIAYAARHDKMTGFLNREHFLEQVTLAHEKRGQDFLLIIDADHFKQINDKYGHMKGDDALVAIARSIRKAVRPQDQVGRIGGEEFGVLLKHLFLSEAVDLAEAIRFEVAGTVLMGPDDLQIPLTVSIGGASLRDFSSVSEVLAHADNCLYRAKRAGRNRVELDTNLALVAQFMARQWVNT